jgi:hypothetical protein
MSLKFLQSCFLLTAGKTKGAHIPAPSCPNKILALHEDGEFIDCFNDY